MKVLHYIPSIDRIAGGTSTYIHLLANELGKLSDLHIVTTQTPTPIDITNATIHYTEGGSIYLLRFRNELERILDSIKPDVVNINCCWTPQCSIAQNVAQRKGYKVVLTPHGMLEPWIIQRHYYTRKLPALLLYQKNAIKKADMIHVTAASEMNHLKLLRWNDKIKNITLGIDIDSIEMKRDWSIKHKILLLSRLHVKKGIELLIDTIDSLRNHLHGYAFVIAGEGDAKYVNTLKQDVAYRNLNDYIQFLGGVYGDEKWNLYKNVDFFVLPTQSENFGLSIAESLASGTPVITTKGTPWEDLNTYNCGMWIERCKEELKKAILQMISIDSLSLQKMGENGRKLIEDKYSSIMMATRMMAMYHDIADV